MRSHARPEPTRFIGGLTYRKAVMVVLSVILFGSFIAVGCLDYGYSEWNPREPRPETGRVHPYLANQTHVYVSETEETVASVLFVGWFMSFLGLIFLGVLKVRDFRRGVDDDDDQQSA